MHRLTSFIKHNTIALAALFIALGGTSYAAVAIPSNSVGTKQLKAGAVTPAKLASKSFGGHIYAFVEIANNGAVLMSSPKGIKTSGWNLNTGGEVTFPNKLPADCYPMASAGSPQADGGSNGPAAVGAGKNGANIVSVGVSGIGPVTLAIVCS